MGPSDSRTKQSAAVDDLLSKPQEHRQRSAKYSSGLHRVRTSTSNAVLNITLLQSDSQWRFTRTGVMWSCRRTLDWRPNKLQCSELAGGAEDGCRRCQPAESYSNPGDTKSGVIRRLPPTSETNGWTAVVGLHVARIDRSDPYRQTDETCEDIVSGQ